jgi:hypothetical protein
MTGFMTAGSGVTAEAAMPPTRRLRLAAFPFAVQRDSEIDALPPFPQELLDLAVDLAILRLDACVLAAQMTRVIALMALAALELSEASFHEPFHAHGPHLGNPATVRNVGDGARSSSASSTRPPCTACSS